MVRSSGLALASVALLVMCAPSAWADVIPSRRAAAKADTSSVQDRMSTLGVPSAEAARETAALPAADAAFFARHQSGVQVVGGLTLEEWLIGGAMAVALLAITFWIVDRTPK